MRTMVMIAWLVMLILLAYSYQRTFGSFLEIPTASQFLVALFVFSTVWLIASAALQGRKLSKRDGELKQLRERLNGLRLALTMSAEQQRDAERATQVMLGTDPEAMLIALQNRILETKRQLTSQKSHNSAPDLQERVKEIQNHQESLREEIGKLVEGRLANAPVFNELKRRQDQIEHALAELETVGGSMSVSDELIKLENANANAKGRTEAVKEAVTTLNRLRGELDEYNRNLLPMRDENSGLAATVDMLRSSQSELNRALDEVELGEGEGGLSRRVEQLLGEKCEAEHRVATLTQQLGTIREARQEIVMLDRERRHIEQSLAEAEVDEAGCSVAERVNELTAFTVEAQGRIVVLQDMLRQLKEQGIALANSQADLKPLISDDSGIKSHLAAASNLHDTLTRSLDELECNGPATLSASVEGLLQNKRAVEIRIEALNEVFARLAAIKTEISALAMSVMGSLSAHAPINVGSVKESSAQDTPQQQRIAEGIGMPKAQPKTEWTLFKLNGVPWRHKREEKKGEHKHTDDVRRNEVSGR